MWFNCAALHSEGVVQCHDKLQVVFNHKHLFIIFIKTVKSINTWSATLIYVCTFASACHHNGCETKQSKFKTGVLHSSFKSCTLYTFIFSDSKVIGQLTDKHFPRQLCPFTLFFCWQSKQMKKSGVDSKSNYPFVFGPQEREMSS